MTASFPAFVFVCLAVYRNSSVFLRKRSLSLILFSCIGTFLVWSVTVLYDALGSEYYPCALFMFINYVMIPFSAMPVLFKLNKYTTELAIIKLSKEIRAQRDNQQQDTEHAASSGRASIVGGMESIPVPTENLGLEGEMSLKALMAHLRIFFKLSRSKKDQILNAKFCRSPGFLIFWFTLSTLPYLVVYFIRLGTTPEWLAGCTGCELNVVDTSILLAMVACTTATGVYPNSFRVSKKDALRVVRECVVTWSVSGALCVVGFSLHLADPGQVYQQGLFNWRFIIFLASVSIVYIQTVHQVLIARQIKHQLIASHDFDRADRFADVMKDRVLKDQLKNHLNGELSNEILLFLDAVNSFKHNGNTASLTLGPQAALDQFKRHAKRIYDGFVAKNAPNEINISFDQREAILVRLVKLNQQGAVDYTIFDEAYEEVKTNFLRDGFGRFLTKLRTMEAEKAARSSVVSAASSQSSWLQAAAQRLQASKRGSENGTAESLGGVIPGSHFTTSPNSTAVSVASTVE